MSKPQKLFDPDSPAELLLGWLVHAHKGRDRHDLAARVYERGRYMLGVPTLIASTIVGTSVFSALSSFGWRGLAVGGLVQRARRDPRGVADVSGPAGSLGTASGHGSEIQGGDSRTRADACDARARRRTAGRSDQRRASDAGRTGGSGPRHHASDLLCDRAAVFERRLRSPGTRTTIEVGGGSPFCASGSRRKVDACNG